MNKLVHAVILTTLVTPKALADAQSGNSLLEDCQLAVNFIDSSYAAPISPLQGMAIGSCFGFLRGATDSAAIYNMYLESDSQPKRFFCVPEDVSTGQLARVVVNGLTQRAARLHEHQTNLTFEILRGAFPCN